MVNVPGLLPGASEPPSATVTAPLMVPPPASVAPEPTCTLPVPVALPLVLFTRSVPPFTHVPPV